MCRFKGWYEAELFSVLIVTQHFYRRSVMRTKHKVSQWRVILTPTEEGGVWKLTSSLLYADDAVLVGESHEQLHGNLNVNAGRSKVMMQKRNMNTNVDCRICLTEVET